MPIMGYFDRKLQECLDLADANEDPLARAVYLAMAEEFRDKADPGRACGAYIERTPAPAGYDLMYAH